MKKPLIGAIRAGLSILIIGGAIVANSKSEDKTANSNVDTMHFTETHKDDGHHNDEKKTEPTKVDKNAVVEANAVEITDFSFNAKNIRVKVGTTVTWTNKDSAKHDIAPDAESANFMPSKLLSMGESYSYTFTKAGMYAYHCSPHPYMKASVEVVE